MGHMIEQIALERGHQIVARIDIDNRYDMDSPAFADADVAIEFTTPQTARQNVLDAWKRGVSVVCGSTGWDAQGFIQEQTENGRLKNVGLIWSSNFSLGVNILFAMNRRLAQLLQPYPAYTPHITEVHHVHKLDAPSGTAVSLAEQIVESQKTASLKDKSRIPIESIREGEAYASGDFLFPQNIVCDFLELLPETIVFDILGGGNRKSVQLVYVDVDRQRCGKVPKLVNELMGFIGAVDHKRRNIQVSVSNWTLFVKCIQPLGVPISTSRILVLRQSYKKLFLFH